MKRILQIALLVSFSLIATQTMAQDAATSSGPVWRIGYVKIKTGKQADHTKWMREYRTRVLAEQKKAGLILDYKFFTKPTGDNSPDDWSIAEAVMYRNYAEALEAPNAENLKKGQEIAIKVFGSVENQRKIWAELRDPSRDLVRTSIIRELIFNPVK